MALSWLTLKLAAFRPRDWAVVALIALLLFGSAGAGGYFLYRDSLPTTTSFNLRDRQKEVPLDQRVVVRLSRPVALESMASGIRITPPTEGALTASGDRRAYTFTPSQPWKDLTDYTVGIKPSAATGARAVTPATLRFTTTLVPRVVAVRTESGSSVAENAEIPINSPLRVVFNTAMDQASVKLLVNAKAAELAWADDARSAGFKIQGIPVGALELSLAPGGTDQTKHPLATNWTLKAQLVFNANLKTVPLKYPAVVQIPNDSVGARDQSGLQAADLVYEYETEGGITRISAVFTRIPESVGPIRSGRLISFRLTRRYHGILALSGLSPGSFSVLNSDPVPTQFEVPPVMYRTADRYAPDNLFIKGAALQAAEEASGVAAYSLPVGQPNVPPGEPAANFAVPEHNSTYAYDAQTGTYVKTEDGTPMAEALLAQPIRMRMVIVLHASRIVTSIIEDFNGARGLDWDLDAGGNAEIYYGGQKTTARWSGDRSNPIVFTLANGQQLILPPGPVWIDVVP